jgi:hypothetical protein
MHQVVEKLMSMMFGAQPASKTPVILLTEKYAQMVDQRYQCVEVIAQQTELKASAI